MCACDASAMGSEYVGEKTKLSGGQEVDVGDRLRSAWVRPWAHVLKGSECTHGYHESLLTLVDSICVY